MAQPPIRLSIVGFGEIGQRHAELITADADCLLAGICDVDPRCRSYADKFGVPVYEDVKELLETEKPQATIIATPNRQHAAIAELCAKQSIHILIEKPIADSMEGANRIVKAAHDNHVQVLVGHHRRHNPLVQETRLALQSGELGKLTAVSMFWTLMKPINYYQKQWRCTRPGGGPTLINLVHELDLLRYLCGEVRQVYAQASSAARQLAVEDTLSISLVLESGAVASILASDTTPSPWSYEATTRENPLYFPNDENCYYFFGTLGSFTFPQMQRWRYTSEKAFGWQHPLEMSQRVVVRADPLK
ncbi:MAG: oxidoreductase, partial [Planctomycetaceae bacterium]|nr:oxidoreductase [Planctomycetaceae bacterium]